MNKPVVESDKGLLVETNSFVRLGQYFPESVKPKSCVILIYGSFGSGKTTMLKYLESYWKNVHEVRTHYLEANLDVSSYENFERYLLLSIYEKLSNHHVSESIPTTEILKLIPSSTPKEHIVLLIDELHKVEDLFVFKFLRDHQATIERIKELPVTIFFAGQEALADQREGKGGITGVFDDEIPLKPLDLTEAVEMIERRLKSAVKVGTEFHNPFNRGAIQQMLDSVNGNPRFVIKTARQILKDNANLPKPIIIDELAVAKATARLTGEALIAIRKTLLSPSYSGVRKRLEKLFASSPSTEKIHDYLAVINALYTETSQIYIAELEEKIRVSGNLERILEELRQERIVSRSQKYEKDKYGTEITFLFVLETSVKNFFNIINDRYKVVPAAYLDKLFIATDVRNEEGFVLDRIMRSFDNAVKRVDVPEAISQLQRAQELYSELKSLDFSDSTKINHIFSVIQHMLIAFNIYTRGEPGLNFESRFKIAISRLSKFKSADEVSEISDRIELLSTTSKALSEDFVGWEKIPFQKINEAGELAFGDLLSLFALEAEELERRKSTRMSDIKVIGQLDDFQTEIRELRAKLEEINLKLPPLERISDIKRKSFMTEFLKNNNFLAASLHPEMIDAFINEIRKADNIVSRELQTDKSFIRDAVEEAIVSRIEIQAVESVDPVARTELLQIFTGAFEEFCRYVTIVMPAGAIKEKISAKESSIGRILGVVLGEEFNSRIMKYNTGNLANLDLKMAQEIESKLEVILEGNDPKLSALGFGQTQLILMTLVRNYCKHTLRENLVAGQRFFTIFDRLLSGFLWFYEYCVEINIIGLHSTALYYGGTHAHLLANPQGYEVITMRPFNGLLGAFYSCYIVHENLEEKYLLVHINPTIQEPIFDLASIPKEISKNNLPDYHLKCIETSGILFTDIDENLFFIKISWYEPKQQNRAKHNNEIAFLDIRSPSGDFAHSNELMSNFYALVFQSGLISYRYSILTPVRFFTCFEELASFIKTFPYNFNDLPPNDRGKLENLLSTQTTNTFRVHPS